LLILTPVIIAWAVIANIFNSQMIGFITILALEAGLGFSVGVGPLCYCAGFEREEYIFPATFYSLLFVA